MKVRKVNQSINQSNFLYNFNNANLIYNEKMRINFFKCPVAMWDRLKESNSETSIHMISNRYVSLKTFDLMMMNILMWCISWRTYEVCVICLSVFYQLFLIYIHFILIFYMRLGIYNLLKLAEPNFRAKFVFCTYFCKKSCQK